MQIKRILCLLLALLMTVSFAACGSKGAEGTANGASRAASEAAADGADKENTESAAAPGIRIVSSGSGAKTVEEMIAEKNSEEPEIEAGGVSYARKKGLATYLFMGIDLAGTAVASDEEYQDTGCADTILLYIVDEAAKTYRILQINRNTMAVVDVLNIYGRPVTQLTQQICYAYCYSAVASANCENVERAVSRLLGGIEIDGYISLQYGAIPEVNDTLGGVAVKIEDDFSQEDPVLVKGETVTLEGDHALHYLRGRMAVGDGSNSSRMRRQMVYLSAFTARLKQEIRGGNSNIINKLYDAAEPYMISDMSMGAISNMVLKCVGYSQGKTVSLTGKAQRVTYKTGITNEEYTVEQSTIDEAVLDLFYTRIEN